MRPFSRTELVRPGRATHRTDQRQQRRHRLSHWYDNIAACGPKTSDHVLNSGYLAIHLLGLSTGTFLLPPSPSHFRRRQQSNKRTKRRDSNAASQGANEAEKLTAFNTARRENDKTATVLFSYTAIWWALLGACMLIGVGGGVSRRMVSGSFPGSALPTVAVADARCPSGQFALYRVGRGVQHVFHPWLSVARPLLLPVAAVAIGVFAHVEA